MVEPLRDEIAELIIAGVASAGARLISFCVMPNHLHTLLFQGTNTLGYVMQPILRRIALMLQRYHNVQGHVFERRYRSKMCRDQAHLRNSILYIHRNPLEAQLCKDAMSYPWSSQRAFAGVTSCAEIAVEDGLRIVACSDSGDIEELRAIYMRAFAAYCKDNVDDAAFEWAHSRRLRRTSASLASSITAVARSYSHLPDIRDTVLRLLRTIDPECDLDLLRSNYRGPRVLQTRRQLIATLIQRDYANVKIAQYFRISDAAVSRIRCAMRWSTLH
jgi:REP element-mobilizing transposase RayT